MRVTGCPSLVDADFCACRFFSFMCILFFVHSTAIGMFRAMGAIGRNLVIAYSIAWLLFIMLILLGGFVIVKSALPARMHGTMGGHPDDALISSVTWIACACTSGG